MKQFNRFYVDTSPVPSFFNETTLTADDDAFFVVEVNGGPSQWFMAASPKHPVMYYSMMKLISNVMDEKDLGGVYHRSLGGLHIFRT